MSHVAVVGAGIFGVTAALSLRRRGHQVSLLDPGPLPHPLAESTDISKVVRLDYGPDDGYLTLMESALEGWRRWNAAWETPLFHEVGVTFLTRAPMAPGGFEHESFTRLVQRGHPRTRLDAAAIRARFPAWSTGAYVDGYWNPLGGYAESGRVVERLLADAAVAGVRLLTRHTFERLDERGSRVAGVITREGAIVAADHVLVAAGAWTPYALPSLAAHLRAVGQPVFHLAPGDACLRVLRHVGWALLDRARPRSRGARRRRGRLRARVQVRAGGGGRDRRCGRGGREPAPRQVSLAHGRGGGARGGGGAAPGGVMRRGRTLRRLGIVLPGVAQDW